MRVSLYSFKYLLHIFYIDHSTERTKATFRLCQQHLRDVTDMCYVIIYHYQWCIWQSPCCPLPQHSAEGCGPQGPAHTGLPPSYAAPSTAEKKLPVNQTNTEINTSKWQTKESIFIGSHMISWSLSLINYCRLHTVIQTESSDWLSCA